MKVSSNVGSGRGALFAAFLAGHLCCLAGFELSRMWEFFPASFRPLVTLSVSAAFLQTLAFRYLKPQERPIFGLLLVSWSSIYAFPFVVPPVLAAILFLVLGLWLAHSLLMGKKRVWALLAVGAVATLKLVFSLWTGLGGLLLLIGLVLELRFALRQSQSALPQSLDSARLFRSEISWRGFAQLYAVCESGEGEKFSRKVLADTVSVIEACGGILESGSEHRGVYTFPDAACQTHCHWSLVRYGEQLVEVLASVKAPAIELIFKNL